MAIHLFNEDCLSWLQRRESESIHAVVTDPPFSVEDFDPAEVGKLRSGSGGVWRQPPTLSGSRRAPVPRFTVLSAADQQKAYAFFVAVATELYRCLVPGAHVFIATTPTLSHLVYLPLLGTGFEKRGEIIRLVQTLRGGDRPKGAESEFPAVTVMPRAGWEPWGLFRKPFEGTVADCLRQWGTGALQRETNERPFTDVIPSSPTCKSERNLSPHPCLKPQAFMRQVVRAALPLRKGVVLDPFMGGGSTIAAAEALGFDAVGLERDQQFFHRAVEGIPLLAQYVCD